MFKEIISRIKAPTPKFFKKLRKIGVLLTAISSPIVAIPTVYPGAMLSDALTTTFSHLLTVGVMLVTISSLAKEDSQENNQ